ncbi:ubiquitin carboxyl-terminal hydrolase [Phlyctema vagabunda]|uniref:Ubiquitin carboxyl-terminal hydrolase n=1 Tax=Phlyctema vagabunda TaxID=108571 RepID=A0ABR4PJY4_9HELO
MDNTSPEELTSRERAASSEPCSTRPNPFDDDEDHIAPYSHKRQRLSRSVSRSRSVDTARAIDSLPDAAPAAPLPPRDIELEILPSSPHTPSRAEQLQQQPPDATPSKFTINLRATHHLETIPSSPSSPTTGSKMLPSEDDRDPRPSLDSESDALSTVAAMETPSSSPSAMGSPQIELVAMSDEVEYVARSPPLAIIDDDEVLMDPMSDFPYNNRGEPLISTVARLKKHLQGDPIESDDVFRMLRDWMRSYLNFTGDNPNSWHLSYMRDREFWDAFPDLLHALSLRRTFFGAFLREDAAGRLTLSEFFVEYARLTGRFVAMDVRTFARLSPDDKDLEPDLASYKYLYEYSYLLRKEENQNQHIGRNLETHYHWDWKIDVVEMTKGFLMEGGTIGNLTKLAKGYKSFLPQIPRMVELLLEPCRLVHQAIYETVRSLDKTGDPKLSDGGRRQITQGYEFFKVSNEGLDYIIDKHVTSLLPHIAAELITQLTDILSATLSTNIPATEELISNMRRRGPKFTEAHYPKVIASEWRFSILHRLIISTQMQLRVVGVTTMCSELLALHSSHKVPDPSQSPVLLHFADFIIRNKLIEYIVGIGSHPEIINESKNILGFLVATKTYTPEVTDIIWKSVMTSQDPRVVEAIVRHMVKGCINIYEYPGLLDICKKVSDLPLEAFNSVLREFCEDLLNYLIKTFRTSGSLSIDAPPYELCIRLMRESSVTRPDRPQGYPEIQVFATTRLRSLLPYGPASEVRDALYLSCIGDISTKSPTTPGSICAINSLLNQNLEADLQTLTTAHGLTGMIIEDFESSTEKDTTPAAIPSPVSQARRELLHLIIVHQPETISSQMGVRLWDVLVGKRSRSAQGRTNGWVVLNSAVKQFPNFKNVFLASCYQQYLPSLPPDCFTLGALDFARSAVMAWVAQLPHGLQWEDQTFGSPVLEQLWRMTLTAPPRNIDGPAIATLVEVFLETRPILTMHRAKARVIHLALVNRCLQQLAAAATLLKASNDGESQSDDESMEIVATDVQFQEQEIVFARSLAVLREFLKAYQSRPHFAKPKQPQLISAAKSTVEGEPLVVKYQSFDGDTQTDVQVLTLGKLNTAASLLASLQEATGFKSYRVYHGGKEFMPDDTAICKSLDDLKLNGLVLVQRRDDPYSTSAELSALDTTVEGEIMKHSDELWGYLGMHEKVAHEIYVFLIKFPIYDQLLSAFEKDDTTYLELFPLGQPFKCLYAVHALRECVLAAQKREESRDEKATTRALKHIVATISDQNVLDSCDVEHLRDALIINLLDCLMGFLRDTPYPELVTSCLDEALLKRLLEILFTVRSRAGSDTSIRLVGKVFTAILEVTSHSFPLWDMLKLNLSNGLLKDLLINDSRPLLRKSIAKQLVERCGYIPSSSITRDFQDTLWSVISSLIPDAVASSQSEDVFFVALPLYKQVLDSTTKSPDVVENMNGWARLLLSLEANEVVGHMESVDLTVHGLAHLLCHAAAAAKSAFAETENEAHDVVLGTIASKLFEKHLFTPISRHDDDETRLVQRIPVLNSQTRRMISDTVFNLVSHSPKQYHIMLDSLARLVPYHTTGNYPYDVDISWNFERIRAVRSWTGYVGLRNLSNTCYLNSLFTQLFMNVSFRDFMLSANVEDREEQRLLAETQVLFSNMQNSLKRFVDPYVVASSIRTYEEGNIDVSIQMDVDEFYNLLFDRWEGQITSDAAKRTFRSFYGGQLVQQVKSKECEHISERLEPFSAIQCDIKGKSTLQESLQAYVDGEVMEGDNKYKCSTCDRHVDAVKRACLKDIPDNLIFHLKRFDFNLRTMQRSKINDYFSFPTTIDMRPYKVDHIMSSPEECPEDVFELVGILVHAGTAESGHYYSFIKERPSHAEDSWVEFNDDIVTPWKSEEMENGCFGGPDYRGSVDHNTTSYDKNYSAYMLFYQRSSVLAAQKEELHQSGQPSPVRLPLPTGQYNHIVVDNELLMRKHCLFDPSHAALVLKMLNNVRHLNKGICSTNHDLEKFAMWTALNFLDQVVARTKDLPDFPVFMGTIRNMCDDCVECSRDYLDWFCTHPETIRYLLLRNPEALVRTDIASSIFSALVKIREEAPYAYGIIEDNEITSDDPQLLPDVVKLLAALWDQFHNNTRAWPEYFGLLLNISRLGDAEAAILVDRGFLRKVLEVITADSSLPQDHQYNRMLNIISKRLSTRPVSYESVIALLYRLLDLVDRDMDPVPDNASRVEALSRLADDIHIPLTMAEQNIIVQHWVTGVVHILTEKLLIIRQNEIDSKKIIILLLHWPDSLDKPIQNAIRSGIKPGPTFVPCGPFLKAALTYCEYSESRSGIERLVKHVAVVARRLDPSFDGKDFYSFFVDLQKLPSNLHDISQEELFNMCAQMLPTWGPGLLAQVDPYVRNSTAAYIENFLRSDSDDDYNQMEIYMDGFEGRATIPCTAQTLGWQCLDYLDVYHIRPKRDILTPCYNSIMAVVDICERFYEDNDLEDVTTFRKFEDEKNALILRIRRENIVVEEADEEVSEWDGSDDVGYSSSQPELNDLNEIEVQL